MGKDLCEILLMEVEKEGRTQPVVYNRDGDETEGLDLVERRKKCKDVQLRYLLPCPPI